MENEDFAWLAQMHDTLANHWSSRFGYQKAPSGVDVEPQ
jgi:hypothetical protein